jgi:ribonuclease J
LKTVHSLVKPRYFVPVHGEYRHLAHHARLAGAMGMPRERTLVIENGQPLVLSPNGHRLEARVETGRVFIDGKGVGDIGEMELRDRRHLANHGLVLVFLALNQGTGEIVAGPEIVSRGFVLEVEGRPLLDEALALVRGTLAEHSREAVAGWEELRVEVRKTLHRFFNRTMDRRPLILPFIMEL